MVRAEVSSAVGRGPAHDLEAGPVGRSRRDSLAGRDGPDLPGRPERLGPLGRRGRLAEGPFDGLGQNRRRPVPLGERGERRGPARPRLAHRASEPQRDEVLVVAELDVVAGPVLLDEIVLEDRRLFLVGRDDRLEVTDGPLQDGDERALVAEGILEIAPHARAQALRLADVNDDRLLVLEQVDAGLRRQRVELLDHGIGEHPRHRTYLAGSTSAAGSPTGPRPGAPRAVDGAQRRIRSCLSVGWGALGEYSSVRSTLCTTPASMLTWACAWLLTVGCCAATDILPTGTPSMR